MEGMQKNLVGDTRREEMRTLYNLNSEFAKGWFLSGETLLQKGAHDKDNSASVQFKRVW